MPLTRKEALEIAKRCEQVLKHRFGVKAVYLFGSVRGDTPFHEASDIDIAVEGLPSERLFEAWAELERIVPEGVKVDLIDLERAKPELAAYVRGEREMPKEPKEALKQQVEDELRAMDEAVQAIHRVAQRMPHPTDMDLVVAAGKYLDDFYNGAERTFERICVWLEGSIPSGEDWHKQLLEHMTEGVAGVRFPLLDEDLAKRLEEFLKFRHRFRHRYGYELVWDKMLPLVEEAPKVLSDLKTALERFFAGLGSEDD